MNNKSLKILILLTAALGALTVFGQSSAPVLPPISNSGETASNLLENIPTVPLAEESVGVSEGTLMRGDSTFAAATLIDYTIHTNFFVRGEFDLGTSSQGIEGIGIGGGICKSWTASRVWGVVEGRKDWNPNKWDGLAGVGVAYTPSTNGILANLSVVAEQRVILQTQNTAPTTETFGGVRYSFP